MSGPDSSNLLVDVFSGDSQSPNLPSDGSKGLFCAGGCPAYFLEDYGVAFPEYQEPAAALEPELLSYQAGDDDLSLTRDPCHFQLQDDQAGIRPVLLLNHPNLGACWNLKEGGG